MKIDNKNYIKEFWDNQAKKFKGSHNASWGDIYAIDLEIKNIANYIKKGSSILDVGCANGYSTFKHLSKHPKSITGVDSSESMIKYANINKKKLKVDDKVKFYVRDIRDLQFKDESFDLTYTTRVLINLENWEQQIIAINECLRVTKKNGMVIFSEAFWEPLTLLNSMRTLMRLSPLVEQDFNKYLKMEKFNAYLNEKKIRYEIIDFSSLYYLGSRFLREIVTPYKKYKGYSNPINKLFFDIEQEYSGGGFGIQQAYVIYK
ncbi:MAG TPA: class I SAM-dependent methyltransferase [Bacteroidales bacterium]|nr:class I SAM-dependent methyltransferase [Bacteroidales bacterium]